MKIVFFGSSKYVIPVIETLKSNFDLSLIVTTESKITDAVPAFATHNNIPYITVKSLKDEKIIKMIQVVDAEVAVLGYFGLIVPPVILSTFPKGIVNIHPSLLPKYRGPTPVQTALLNGDKETGTTIIVLDNEVDHGGMLTQQKENILPSDTTDSLHTRLFKLGSELVNQILPKYVSGQIDLIDQDHNSATYTNHLSKHSGQFDINNPPNKQELDRMIRAYFPWPTAWTRININGKEKIVKFLPNPLSLRGASELSDVAISIKYLIQVEGGKPMGVKDFINGYPHLGDWIRTILG